MDPSSLPGFNRPAVDWIDTADPVPGRQNEHCHLLPVLDCPGAGTFTCPECGRTTPNPNDVRERYCPACHWWTGNPELGAHGRAERAALRAGRIQIGALTGAEWQLVGEAVRELALKYDGPAAAADAEKLAALRALEVKVEGVGK
jgi:hypothetical protein